MMIAPLKGWKFSNNFVQPEQFKILSMNKLRADCSQEMLAIIRCRIVCLSVVTPKFGD